MSDVPSPSQTPSRLCLTCGRQLPCSAAFFHRDAFGSFGLKRRCRDCVNEAERGKYASSADDIRQRMRTRRAERAAYWTTQPPVGGRVTAAQPTSERPLPTMAGAIAISERQA